ncbi:hypothetical protein A2318_03915 [Candidatus Uhrbacteria bacterium RIFOXYB2_FULL_45_11]|uniref:Uncharacterized protein n=1 Tax=Candidatus Uhrbacteria bacterium RIFOXYB2_FULL_45_11 TaxID=1802421 RepID=A0A1F7W737_9BACT|nr:MAG: hypothetical protein A2318_03915 [Candidatus Uhrbacteria bacterium RIFOXYB2_FULL_45_11]
MFFVFSCRSDLFYVLSGLEETNMPKEKWQEDFDYITYHTQKYLAETPPPHIVFYGHGWWLPDLSIRPGEKPKRGCFLRTFFSKKSS